MGVVMLGASGVRDRAKKLTGRKCHILVDTSGLLHGIHVTAASVQDRDGARELLSSALGGSRAAAVFYADSANAGELERWVLENTPTRLQIVPRRSRKFEVLPKRWIVERTFGWEPPHPG
jgi:putative transposase